MTLEEQLRKRLNTDKLITRFINDVKEDVEWEYPTHATTRVPTTTAQAPEPL